MCADLRCCLEPPVGVEPTTYALRTLSGRLRAKTRRNPCADSQRHRMWSLCGLTPSGETCQPPRGEADKPTDLGRYAEPPIGVEPMTYALRVRRSSRLS